VQLCNDFLVVFSCAGKVWQHMFERKVDGCSCVLGDLSADFLCSVDNKIFLVLNIVV